MIAAVFLSSFNLDAATIHNYVTFLLSKQIVNIINMNLYCIYKSFIGWNEANYTAR